MMHSGFDDIDYVGDEGFDDDPPPSTDRTPGSATLEVEDKMDALFISASWRLIARVKNSRGEIVIVESTSADKPHSKGFMRRWARQAIRDNVKRLRHMGVDVDATYLKWGGILEDL